MKTKIDWTPSVGDVALCPGVPVRHYIDALNQSDIDAINRGRGGYYPLFMEITPLDPRDVSSMYMKISYSERYHSWSWGTTFLPFHWPTVIRSLNRYFGANKYTIRALTH
jgi:hypothetical protein